MTDDKTIELYLKVKALAEQGVSGEKENAIRTMNRLREKYPTIERDVLAYQRRNGMGGQPWPPRWSPEDILRTAQAAAGWATEFVSTISNAQYGAALAEEVNVSTRFTRANNAIISFKMDLDLYDEGSHLNDIQREAFRKELHRLLDEEIDAMFEGDDEDDFYDWD